MSFAPFLSLSVGLSLFLSLSLISLRRAYSGGEAVDMSRTFFCMAMPAACARFARYVRKYSYHTTLEAVHYECYSKRSTCTAAVYSAMSQTFSLCSPAVCTAGRYTQGVTTFIHPSLRNETEYSAPK